MRLAEWIDVAAHPSCWIQNYAYSAAWEDELTRLLHSGHRLTRKGRYTARFGTIEVWIANHPYASFTYESHDERRRPRRATILRLGRLLTPADKDFFVPPRCHCAQCEPPVTPATAFHTHLDTCPQCRDRPVGVGLCDTGAELLRAASVTFEAGDTREKAE